MDIVRVLVGRYIQATRSRVDTATLLLSTSYGVTSRETAEAILICSQKGFVLLLRVKWIDQRVKRSLMLYLNLLKRCKRFLTLPPSDYH